MTVSSSTEAACQSRNLGGPAANGALCRFCRTRLEHTFVDLGMSPLCENYLAAGQLNQMEPFYPLHARVCASCFLVQLEEYVAPKEIFTEYAYFSSYSSSWLAHAKAYVDAIVNRLALGGDSRVVEVASNDGYLLQYFVERGIPVLGIEPAANIAQAARAKGVPTLVRFFGKGAARELVAEGRQGDLIIGNNVLAQVPDLNDFVAGLRMLLKRDGAITLEFPHLVRLVEENQLDTIYHEHFSYFSFTTAKRVLAAHGLRIFHVEELSTHGGSLRVYACRAESARHGPRGAVDELLNREQALGLNQLDYYRNFGARAAETKRKLLSFLIDAKRAGRNIVGYGAPGKGNTMLNYCGVRTDLLDYTVDRNPYKQGKFLPGTHIPIHHPDRIRETRPDYVLILPWNLRDEIVAQLAYVREWGGKFVVAIPETKVLP